MLPNDVKNQSKFCWTAIVMMSRNCLGAEGSSLVTSRLGSCSSAMSNSPAFFLPFCFLALFSSTSADVGSMIDRAVSSSQDKTQENISRLCTLHESHFWLWRWGRQANTAVIYRTRRSCIRRSFIVCKINNLRQVFFPETAKEKKKHLIWSYKMRSHSHLGAWTHCGRNCQCISFSQLQWQEYTCTWW